MDVKVGAPRFANSCFLHGKVASHTDVASLTEPACVTKLTATEFLISKPGPKNFGYYPNDGFNDKLQNVERISFLVTDEDGEDSEFLPYLGIAPLKHLANKLEMFHRYGKLHWCFKPNFETLNQKQKIECKKYYEIKPKEIREVHPYATSGAAAAAAAAK